MISARSLALTQVRQFLLLKYKFVHNSLNDHNVMDLLALDGRYSQVYEQIVVNNMNLRFSHRLPL